MFLKRALKSTKQYLKVNSTHELSIFIQNKHWMKRQVKRLSVSSRK